MADIRMWQKCCFSDWLNRCSIMDEWEKSLREMRYCDWVIHRKLGEEVGLHCRYITPARGSGKSLLYDSFEDHKSTFKKRREDLKPKVEVHVDKYLYDLSANNRAFDEEFNEIIQDFYRRKLEHDARKTVWLDTFNPYLQPEGYWYDPSWIVRPDGSLVLRELSVMPGYLLDKENL